MKCKDAKDGQRVCLEDYIPQRGTVLEVRRFTCVVAWDGGRTEEIDTLAIRPAIRKDRTKFASAYPGHGTRADPEGLDWGLEEHPDMRGEWGRFTRAQYNGGGHDE